MEKYQKIEKMRLEKLGEFKKTRNIAIILFLSAILSLFIGIYLAFDLILFVVALIVIIGIIFVGKAANFKSKYRDFVKNELIKELLNDQFEEVIYLPRQSIPISQINKVGLIRKPDRHSGEDYIKGKYKGVNFEISDIELKEERVTTDANGNTTVTYQTYFKGRWYIYRFSRTFEDVLKISEGRFAAVTTRGLKKLETESIEFNKKFRTFVSNPEFGFYHITPAVIHKLMELEKMHRGTIQFCIMSNELHIGVNDNYDYMEFPLNKPINEQSIKHFMADIDLIPAIINELRLDSQKYNL